MGTDFVVVATPVLDDGGGFDAISEPLHAEAFVAEAAVEAFVGAVLPRFAGSDVSRFDAFVGEPSKHGGRDEF